MTVPSAARQLVESYYRTLDAGGDALAGLAAFYRPDSLLTFEGTPTPGDEDIVARLSATTPPGAKHLVTTFDEQPTRGGGVLVTVIGSASIGDGRPVPFSDTFHLAPIADGGHLFIANQILRVIAVGRRSDSAKVSGLGPPTASA
jgi:hypothetical protein